MNRLRYDYNLPWRGAVIGAIFYAALSFFTARLAERVSGGFSICLILLAGAFALLAVFMVLRRVLFPRTLELTDDAILYPHGFPRTRIARIAFGDIIRMCNGTSAEHPSFCLETDGGMFGIGAARFTNIQNYCSVKEFVFSKAAISLQDDGRAPVGRFRQSRWFPEPILRWSEPEDYIRYRTHLAVSKPLWLRLAKTLRFSVCFFGFFFLPWLAMQFFFTAGSPALPFVSVLLPVTVLLALLNWSRAAHPARVAHITVFKNGIHELSGKQTRHFSYGCCGGWSVLERDFKGRTFYILLLQRPKWIYEAALPDTDTRDRLIQIFNEKKIPRVSNLEPSWEST